MSVARKAWWQQATALVTVSAGGVITGFNFVPGAATPTTPASVPLHQLALEQAAQPDTAGKATASDAQLRAAIVNVARYYLKLAQTKTPAQMEALIWGEVSSDGADHGPTCAAFASLTLELAAQTTGLRSWVTGGTTYPWPLPTWADVRVDTNPASPQITSVVADAQAHGRWHPLGDGYVPQPGDWVVYDGHVAVVVTYSGGSSTPSPPTPCPTSPSTPTPLPHRSRTRASSASSTMATSSPQRAKRPARPSRQRRSQAARPRLTPRLLPRRRRRQRRQPPPRSPACLTRSRSRGRAAFPALAPLRGTAARASQRRRQCPGCSPPVSSSASPPRVPRRGPSRPRPPRRTQSPRPPSHPSRSRRPRPRPRRPPVRPRSSTPRRGRGTSRRSSAWSRPARSPPSSALAYPHR